MSKVERLISEVGLKELAEAHVGRAVERLGKLIEHEDARIALEASQAILRIARPHSPGVWTDLSSAGAVLTPWDLVNDDGRTG